MKKISRRNFLKGAAVLGTAAAMTACGGSSSSTSTAASTSAAASTGAASAAEASGKLVIYSPNSDTQIDCTLTNGFMVKYPNIEVELQSMGTGDVLARIEAEKENPQADIDWGAINFNFYAFQGLQGDGIKLLLLAKQETGLPIVSEIMDASHIPLFEDVDIIQVGARNMQNFTLLKELGVEVKGYADLLQPELKGKIAMGDPTASSSAFAELTNMLLDMGEGDTPADRYMSDAAWDYIAKFIDNIDGIVLSSSSQVYKNVIAGEYAVGVSYEDPVVQAIIDNKDNPDADLSLVYPEEGAVWLPAGVAIVKNAPNMDNAKLFVDYVLSEEAQTALSKTTIRGTMTSIAQDCPEMKPFEEINVVYEDQAAVAELQTEMLEKWTNLLTK